MSARHAIEQQLRRLLADLVDRLRDRCEPRTKGIRPGEIVEASHRYVPGTIHSKIAERFHEPKHRLVIDGKNRSGRRGPGKKSERGLTSPVVRKVPQLDERTIERQ